MESGTVQERAVLTPSQAVPHVRGGWDRWPARIISQIGSPPVVTAAAMFAVTWAYAQTRPWRWAALYVLTALLLPVTYLAWLVHRGRITDLDVQRREQRFGPMLFTLGCGGATCILFWAAAAPPQVLVLAGISWLQTLLLFLVTLRWKISVHCAAAAAAAVVTGAIWGSALPILIGLPLIAWSRVRLRRHTPAQTVAGSALGAAFALLAWLWMQWC